MAFSELAPQPPIYPAEAEIYGEDSLRLSCAAAARTRRIADIAYGRDDQHRLDVYLPDAPPDGDLPVLVFAHGGAWTNGYKEWMALMAPPVVRLPAILVLHTYRLAPTNRFPDQLEDVLSVLAWVQAHIGRYGGDTGRVFVGGHSAGAHLWALACVRRDLHARFGLGPGAVRACLPLSGQMTLEFDPIPPGGSEERIHRTLLRRPSDAPGASPLRYAAHASVPFLIAYGGNDLGRIIHSSRRMYDALQRAGVAVELMELEGMDHFDTALSLQHAGSPWQMRLARWMSAGPPAP